MAASFAVLMEIRQVLASIPHFDAVQTVMETEAEWMERLDIQPGCDDLRYTVASCLITCEYLVEIGKEFREILENNAIKDTPLLDLSFIAIISECKDALHELNQMQQDYAAMWHLRSLEHLDSYNRKSLEFYYRVEKFTNYMFTMEAREYLWNVKDIKRIVEAKGPAAPATPEAAIAGGARTPTDINAGLPGTPTESWAITPPGASRASTSAAAPATGTSAALAPVQSVQTLSSTLLESVSQDDMVTDNE